MPRIMQIRSAKAKGLHHHNRPETPVMSEPTEESKLWEYLGSN